MKNSVTPCQLRATPWLSDYEWDNSFSLIGVIGEICLVPFMRGNCPGEKICKSKYGKGKTWQRPGKDSPSKPFNNLPKIMGT